MKLSIPPAMSEALQLTRTGNLKGATTLIQAALGGAHMEAPQSEATAKRHEAPAIFTEPAGATSVFEERSFEGPAGQLAYRLYKPASAQTGMPLVVMLHGCTQSPEDFARGTRMNRLADELGFLVAYPRQTSAANVQKCWNWFKPDDQKRNRGEPALIAGVTRQIIAEEGADHARVYIAGLSAGGAAAAVMCAAYPDVYAAAGIHSGLRCGCARDVPSALIAMKNGSGKGIAQASFVPLITFHGDRDTTVHEVNSREIVAAAAAASGAHLHKEVERGTRGSRSYTRETMSDAGGHILIEQWTVHGAGHAWSGGDQSGSYADAAGPDASREMLRFFLSHRMTR